jgi:hypothetical protein
MLDQSEVQEMSTLWLPKDESRISGSIITPAGSKPMSDEWRIATTRERIFWELERPRISIVGLFFGFIVIGVLTEVLRAL